MKFSCIIIITYIRITTNLNNSRREIFSTIDSQLLEPRHSHSAELKTIRARILFLHRYNKLHRFSIIDGG